MSAVGARGRVTAVLSMTLPAILLRRVTEI